VSLSYYVHNLGHLCLEYRELSLGLNRSERKAYHLLPNTEVMNEWSFTSTSHTSSWPDSYGQGLQPNLSSFF
jgi:hypothetical protein